MRTAALRSVRPYDFTTLALARNPVRPSFGLIGISMIALVSGKPAPESDSLQAAASRLGVRAIQTVQFTGSGAMFSVGQNFAPHTPWPRVPVKQYTATIDFESASMRQDIVREMGATMPRGGGVPFTGEQHEVETVSGDYAWDEPVPPDPQAGAFSATPCTPPETGGTAPVPAPSPGSQPGCMLMLWATPQGFIRAAMDRNATRTNTRDGAEVSFAIAGKYKMIGLLNTNGDVARVRTWTEQSIVGDMLVETDYSNYRDFGGVRFPSHILQKQDGFPSLDLTVTSVTVNRPVQITVPDSIRNAPPAPTTVNSQALAPGVFWLTGGTHHSLAVAMRDYIVLVDTPNGEPRASAVIEKTKELIPDKPIRYVVAMHHHWDHMGGIRTAIDEGATIITHETNRALLERAATAPFTIAPDRLSRSKKPLKLETMTAKRTLDDGQRTIQLYTMTGFDHTDDMILVYLPKERILAEADAYTPPPTPTGPLIAPKVPYAASLYANIKRLGLNVGTIAPFHGNRVVAMDELVYQVTHATHKDRDHMANDTATNGGRASTVRVRYMVNAVEPAVSFYTKYLGFDAKSADNPNFAMLTRGNLELVLSTPYGPGGAAKPMADGRKAEPGGWNRIILNMDDLPREVDRLRHAGLHFRSDILQGPGGSEILLDDPSGNPVELFQPARH
jgi:glyoxylase-like metal-dependent hydrolase (beta-lactamase superfamily II)